MLRPKPRSTELNDIRLCELYDQSFHCQQIEAKTRRINGSPGLQGAIKPTTLIQRLSSLQQRPQLLSLAIASTYFRSVFDSICLILTRGSSAVFPGLETYLDIREFFPLGSITLLKFIFHIHAIGVLWRNIYGEMVISKENLDVALGEKLVTLCLGCGSDSDEH